MPNAFSSEEPDNAALTWDIQVRHLVIFQNIITLYFAPLQPWHLPFAFHTSYGFDDADNIAGTSL